MTTIKSITPKLWNIIAKIFLHCGDTKQIQGLSFWNILSLIKNKIMKLVLVGELLEATHLYICKHN